MTALKRVLEVAVFLVVYKNVKNFLSKKRDKAIFF